METNKDLDMEITGNYKTLHVKTTQTLKMTTPSVVFFLLHELHFLFLFLFNKRFHRIRQRAIS